MKLCFLLILDGWQILFRLINLKVLKNKKDIYQKKNYTNHNK